VGQREVLHKEDAAISTVEPLAAGGSWPCNVGFRLLASGGRHCRPLFRIVESILFCGACLEKWICRVGVA
jgi:hypothetical protein